MALSSVVDGLMPDGFRARRLALPLLLGLLIAFAAQAQIPFVQPKTEAARSAPSPEVDARAQSEARLDEARRQQDAEQAGSGAPQAGEAQPISERRRLIDRLVIAYSEQIKLHDELAALQKAAATQAQEKLWATEFAGPPPYSLPRIDSLRDDIDAGRDRLRSLESTERGLESMRAGRVEGQRRAAEAVRLAEDRLARARGQEEVARERASRDLALLQRQFAEAEVTNLGLGLDLTRQKIASLQALNAERERLLARVLPEQRLSREDIEREQALLGKELNSVNAQTDAIVSANSRRSAERQRLARLVERSPGDVGDARRLQQFDVRLETERIQLLTLSWLQTLLQLSIDAWGQRYAGFHATDATTRQAVVDWLRKTLDDLRSRMKFVDEMKHAAAVSYRDQELRLAGSQVDRAAAAHDAAVLAALRDRVVAYERVSRLAMRLQRQLERWLEDFGFQGTSASSPDSTFAALQLLEVLKRIWNLELFAVEDSTVIDGRTVTIGYGVTIGKSIGALLLFVLGYGLFSLLSRRLQRLMVSRWGVDQQIASVMRRWAMIALAAILVIFILNLARIPLTAFAFLGGALAIGVGFGTQTIIKNVISGIIILFERKIRVGDIIALGGMTGHVIAVDLRASTVRGFDGVEALVPNSSFLENQVVNWTYTNPRIRREIRVGIAYGSPVHQAAEIVAGCARDHGQVLREPPPEVFFEDFGDSALLLVLVFWVELGANLVARRVDSDLRYAIEKRLGAAGIRIPFPQRDVHLDLPLAVHLAGDTSCAGPANAGESSPAG